MNATTFFNTTTTVLSFAVLAAAVSPAKADTTVFRDKVERSIKANLQMPLARPKQGIATVAVHITADGAVKSAELLGSTGSAAYDNEAVRTAKAVSYPAGAARNIVMVLGFDRTIKSSDRAKSVTLASQYLNDSRQLLATETTAKPNG